MRRLVLSTVLLTLVAIAVAQDAGVAHSATTPVPRDGWAHDRAMQIQKNVDAMPDARVVFIGDSITQGWEGQGKDIWAKRYAPLNALNLGIGGDRTQHVLWRLENGNVRGLNPDVAVIMIGTNNSNGNDNTITEIAQGVQAIIASVHARLPETHILLLGIFPRGAEPNAQRGKVCQVNQIIRKLGDESFVTFLDIGHVFIDDDGTIPPDIMPDQLHLSPKGYALWADAIQPTLETLLK